jgi:hypothetical protein
MKQLLIEPKWMKMLTNDWTQVYIEMGSRDKKTNKLKYYKVTSFNHKRFSCSCPSYEFGRGSECKHIKNLKRKLSIW